MKLTLVRGLPGSGKTTLARKLAAESGSLHFEADLYLEAKGDYQQRVAQRGMLKRAQNWCRQMTENALRTGQNVVVSNTFTTHSEMYPYRRLAKTYGAQLEVVVCRGTYGSVHRVPAMVFARMRARWEE